jgi:hypothetical protein
MQIRGFADSNFADSNFTEAALTAVAPRERDAAGASIIGKRSGTPVCRPLIC